MRVEFRQEGGFAALPGLSRPVTIDGDDLTAAQQEQLQSLLEACDFNHLPAKASVHPGAADYRRYTVTVVDGRHRHTAQFVDPIEDEHVQSLIDFLDDLRRNPTQTGI